MSASKGSEFEGRRFEELLAMLQETVTRLDGNELTLDEAVAAYERCVSIANACTAMLDNAELRISQISADSSRLREQPAVYSVESLTARRLLLGEDEDDLADLLDDDI